MRALPLVLLLAPALASAQWDPPLWQQPPHPPPIGKAPPPAPVWSGNVNAGLIELSGNANSLTMTGAAGLQRDSERWIFAARATGAYGRSQPADRTQPTQTVALAASLILRADRRLGPHLTAFGRGGVDMDHVASLEYRAHGDLGMGYVWLDRKEAGGRELFLRTDLGGGYAYDARFQYYATSTAPVGSLPHVEFVGARGGVSFRYAMSKAVSLTEDAEALVNVVGAQRWLARSTTKLSSHVTSSLGIGLSYALTHDSVPAPGKVRTDTALGVTLELAF